MAAAPIKRGLFVVVEGLDRSGKSTQVKRLVEALQRKGVQVEACRFPGESPVLIVRALKGGSTRGAGS